MELDTLRRIKSLASLHPHRLTQVSRDLVWRRYSPGELILPHQVPLHLNGVVHRGKVQVTTVLQGRRQTVGYIQAGEAIDAELWTGQVLPIELRAIETTILCLLPADGARPTTLSGLPPEDLLPDSFPMLLPQNLHVATVPGPSPRLTDSSPQAASTSTSTANRTAVRVLFAALVLLLGLTAWCWQSLWRVPLSKVTYTLASRHLEIDEYTDALPLLQTSVYLNPRLASAYNDIGYILYRQGRPREAGAAFHQAVGVDPTFAVAQSNLGLSYLEEDQLDLAREALLQAVTLNPESPAAWTNLGMVERLAGRPEQSIRAYRAALHLNPRNVTAQANLGVLYYEQEQFSEAKSYLEAALNARPDLAHARAILGAISLGEEDYSHAWRELLAASSDLADDPLLHFYLALWYEEAGLWESAERELGRVLVLEPHPDLAALAHSHLAVLASYD